MTFGHDLTPARDLAHRVLTAARQPDAVREVCLGALAAPGHLLASKPMWAGLFLTWSDAMGSAPTEAVQAAAVACEFMAAGFDLLDGGDDRRLSPGERSFPFYASGMTMLLSAQELMTRLQVPAERQVLAAAILARACRRTLAAQIQDVVLRGQDGAAPASVLAILRRRSGTLVAAPCQCVVALHGGSRHALALAGGFGEALGVAAQLEDDLTDLAVDAKSGRQTLPTVLAAAYPAEPGLATAAAWVLIQRFLREAALVLDRLSPHCRRPEVLWTLLPPAFQIGLPA